MAKQYEENFKKQIVKIYKLDFLVFLFLKLGLFAFGGLAPISP